MGDPGEVFRIGTVGKLDGGGGFQEIQCGFLWVRFGENIVRGS